MSSRNGAYYARHPGLKRQENGRYFRANRQKIYKAKADRRSVKRAQSDADMRFVAFDGEGSKGLYWLLACSATDEVLVNEQGLGTTDCLTYFAKLLIEGTIRSNDAIIGFGLSYDFENILRDVPNDIFDSLRKGNTKRWGPWSLSYVQRKFLDVGFRANGKRYHFRLQDIYPYFQQSFIKACESRGVVLPPSIKIGKRQRAGFKFSDIEKIKAYNRDELNAMVELADTLRAEFQAAYDKLGVVPKLGKYMWYGPGAQAGATLKTLDYEQLRIGGATGLMEQGISRLLDHQMANSVLPSVFEVLHKQSIFSRILSILLDAFSLGYYGGRIECSLQGRLEGPLYDYDLLSAYPYAMTRLPIVRGKRVIETKRLDPNKRVGIYLIRWEPIGDGHPYGPFPYRAYNDNVYYPLYGTGWYMSPEVYAAIKVGKCRVKVLSGYIIEGTEGYGSGRKEGDSDLAQFVTRMGVVRAAAKAVGDPAHRGLKLIMNSLYGKTLQKEGTRQFFNAFVAAWITSVTRSLIYEAIGPAELGEVVSVMTDGILSRVPLNVTLGSDLGSWELTTYASGFQFAPGVYVLFNEKGEKIKRYRGFIHFDEDAAIRAMEQGVKYVTRNKVFVSRTLGQHQAKLGRRLYQFVPVRREEEFSLASKRKMQSPRLMAPNLTYYPPKMPKDVTDPSWPYDVLSRKQREEEVNGATISG